MRDLNRLKDAVVAQFLKDVYIRCSTSLPVREVYLTGAERSDVDEMTGRILLIFRRTSEDKYILQACTVFLHMIYVTRLRFFPWCPLSTPLLRSLFISRFICADEVLSLALASRPLSYVHEPLSYVHEPLRRMQSYPSFG